MTSSEALRPVRLSYRRFAAPLAALAAGLLLSVCADPAAGPNGRAGSTALLLAPVFSPAANSALQAYHAAAIDLDRVRVTITRSENETLADTTILLAGRGVFVLELSVRASVGEVLTARLEYRTGATILFAGSAPVTARASDASSASPDQIPVLPVGPGATATRVTVTPQGGTFPTTAPVTFSAHAFDQSNTEIAGALIDWSVDNAAVGSVSSAGVVQPTPLGGTLHVRATALSGVSGESVVTFVVPPGQLAIATQPSGAVSGITFTTQPVVQIRDAGNSLVATSTAAVTAAVTTGNGTLVGTRTVNAVNGVATFTNLRIDGSGAQTLTFTATGFNTATSSSFTVTQTAAALSIQTQPGGATSGRAFTVQPVVRILDNAGLVVTGSALAVTATRTIGSGTLSGTTTVNAANGIVTFTNLALDGSGAHALTFSTTTPALQVVSATFNVTAATPTQLAITVQPGGAVSGAALVTQPVIEVRDAANTLVPTGTVSINASIASGTGTLIGSTTVTAVNGVAAFTNLRINGGGAHTLVFAATGLSSATSAAFTVTQTPAALGIFTQPGGATSGSPMLGQPVIHILDNAGLIANSTLAVTATISSGNGAVVSGGTVNAVAGVATFTALRVDGTGPQVLTFSIASPALQVVSNGFAVNASPATQIVITTQPNGGVSGVNFTTQPVLQVRDANNAIVTGATVTVLATIASGTGLLVGNTSVATVNGVATFTGLRINGAGPHTIAFIATGLPTVTSAVITITQTPASLFLQTQPAGSRNGAPLTVQPVVRILDNANLLITTSTLAVTATITIGNGTISAGGTVTAVGGVATFTNLTVNGSGGQTMTFSTSNPPLQITAAPFAVNSLGSTHPVIRTRPGGATSEATSEATSKATSPIPVGQFAQTTAENATGDPVSGCAWTSSNASVATVTSSGLVRGMARGTAIITATCQGTWGSVTVAVR